MDSRGVRWNPLHSHGLRWTPMESAVNLRSVDQGSANSLAQSPRITEDP